MFQQRLKQLCAENGISYGYLERKLGFGNGSLGKGGAIQSDRLIAIADYFGVGTDYLLGRDEKTYKVSLAYKKLIDGYEKLDESDKKTIRKMIQVLLENDKYKKHIQNREVS